MKKKIFFWVIPLIAVILAFNIKVSTKQGINEKIYTFKIPLYLKVLDFFDRHYNYQRLARRITGDSTSAEERALKIFRWTHENIKRIPEGYPSIDDHVWHIIVRGLGAADQSSDVFTTLCNYSGIEAFYNVLYTKGRASCIPLSFVRLGKQWAVFDPYNGVYFKNNRGGLASVEDVIAGEWSVYGTAADSDINYAAYFQDLSPITGVTLKRSNMQSPFRRLKYEIAKWLR